MRKASSLLVASTFVLVAAGIGAALTPTATGAGDDRSTAGKVLFERTPERLRRGEYLVEGPLHCFMCHSELDRTARPLAPKVGRKAGGQIIAKTDDRPFDIVIPNISSDPETGAGTWSDEQIARAIRRGIGHDGRTLFSMMPYRIFHEMADEDLASVVAYLRTVPPVHNALPKMVLPAKLAATLEPLPPPGRVPLPDASSALDRGTYLVHLAGCVGCHTPLRDGEPIPGLEFSGGHIFNAMGGGSIASGNLTIASANLTTDPSGIPYYDEGLFIKTMRAGAVNGVRPLDTIMPWSFFRRMTDDDLRDIFIFLKSLKPVLHRVCNTEKPTYCPLCGGYHGYGNLNEAPAQAKAH